MKKLVLISFLLTALYCLPVRAQTNDDDGEGLPETEIVALRVPVRDKNKNGIPGLTDKMFFVTDNGRPAPIMSFSPVRCTSPAAPNPTYSLAYAAFEKFDSVRHKIKVKVRTPKGTFIFTFRFPRNPAEPKPPC